METTTSTSTPSERKKQMLTELSLNALHELTPYYDELSHRNMTVLEYIAYKKKLRKAEPVGNITRSGEKPYQPPRLQPFQKDDVPLWAANLGLEIVGQEQYVKFLPPVPPQELLTFELRDTAGKVLPLVNDWSDAATQCKSAQVPDYRRKTGTIIPISCPTYGFVNPDSMVINKLHIMMTDQLRKGPVSQVLVKELDDLVNGRDEVYYGNGCLEGQVRRLKACWEVRDRVYNNKQFVPTLEQIDDLWPMNKRRFSWSLDRLPSELLFLAEEEKPKVILYNAYASRDSESGLYLAPQSKAPTRGESIMIEVNSADAVYNAVDLYGMNWLANNWPWVKAAKLKPKAEIYMKADFSRKTRNIFVLNGCVALLQSFMVKPAFEHHAPPTHRHPNLLGWSVFHGNLHNLLLESKRVPGCLWVYADNLYLTAVLDNRVYWFSLDAEKAESCHTFKDMNLMTSRIGRFWGEGVGKTWKTMLVNFLPYTSMNNVTVLGNQQFHVPGLASGVSCTAVLNHQKTLSFVIKWRMLGDVTMIRRGGKWDFSDTGIKAMEEVGINFKIERVVDLGEVGKGLEDLPEYLDLDLLGYGAYRVVSQEGDRWFPVLAHERMMRTLNFTKQEMSREFGEHHRGYKQMLRFCRLKALYLIGGWRYAYISRAIAAAVHSLKEDAVRAIDESEVREDIIDKLNLTDEEWTIMAPMFLKTTTPTVSEVYSLNGGEVDPAFGKYEENPLYESYESFETLMTSAPQSANWADIMDEHRPPALELPSFIVLTEEHNVTQKPKMNVDPHTHEKKPVPQMTNMQINSIYKLMQFAMREVHNKTQGRLLEVSTRNNKQPNPEVNPLRMFLADFASGMGMRFDVVRAIFNEKRMVKNVPKVSWVVGDGPSADDKQVTAIVQQAVKDFNAKKQKKFSAV